MGMTIVVIILAYLCLIALGIMAWIMGWAIVSVSITITLLFVAIALAQKE